MYAGYFIIIASKKPFKTIIGKEKEVVFYQNVKLDSI